MERAQGLLAPARFTHNAVIDFDGPRSRRTADAYARVVECLDAEGIAFTRHWAKSCHLDAARVAADYGEDFRRWRARSEEHTYELQSLMRISYAVFCLKKKKKRK